MDDKLKSLINLVKRSNPDADGWCNVSKVCMPLLRAMPADLAVVDENADGSGRVRFTDRGQAVADYL